MIFSHHGTFESMKERYIRNSSKLRGKSFTGSPMSIYFTYKENSASSIFFILFYFFYNFREKRNVTLGNGSIL